VTGVVGVELGRESVRAVVAGGLRPAANRTFEMRWDPERPAELVAALRGRFGMVRGVALSVSLAFLYPKHVRLPPAPAPAKRRILALEPDRFFPVSSGRTAISLVSEADVAFAMPAELVERWVSAFEEWAPVESVEPAPVSLARGLGGAAGGVFLVEAGAGEQGWVVVEHGRVCAVRRAPRDSAPPDSAGAADTYTAARGAARGLASAPESMLLTDPLAARIQGRRVRRLVSVGVMCAAALALAAWSLDRSRERLLGRIRAEVAALTPQAQAGLELQTRLAALDREAAVLRDLGRARPDVLRVLAALSTRLPRDATVLGVKVAGEDWQIDGTAPDAAAIVPLLDRDEQFEAVRILSASSRFREGNRDLETFSIAFRVRPGP